MPRRTDTAAMIDADCEIRDTSFGQFSEVGRGGRFLNVTLGDYTRCDPYCDLANAYIGKFAHIASFVRIGAPDHPRPEPARVTTLLARRHGRKVHIGNDTWIGHSAEIRPGVAIGDGAIVAPGAIVSRNVAPYTIVAGTPARVLRLRQPRDIAERLCALAWWDWDHDTLRLRLEDLRRLDAEAFLASYAPERPVRGRAPRRA